MLNINIIFRDVNRKKTPEPNRTEISESHFGSAYAEIRQISVRFAISAFLTEKLKNLLYF